MADPMSPKLRRGFQGGQCEAESGFWSDNVKAFFFMRQSGPG